MNLGLAAAYSSVEATNFDDPQNEDVTALRRALT